MKRLLSLILTVALLLSIMPTGLFNITVSGASDYYTEGYYTYRITDGKAEIVEVDKSISGNIIIPAELGGYRVTSIGNFVSGQVFKDCTNITGVSIPDGVVEIWGQAFYGCTNLKRVSIPASVTYIHTNAFENSGLTDIYISDIAAWVSINFSGGLASVWDNYNPRTLYLNGVPITDLNIPDGVTSINEYAFYNCNSLTKVTIPNSVTNIGYAAFKNCSNLRNVSIGDGVTSIEQYAFSGCKALKEITIGKSVTSISCYVFKDCTSLKEVTIPDGVVEIQCEAFYGCTNLTRVTIPSSVTHIETRAFGNSGLTDVYISDIAAWVSINFDYDAVWEWNNYNPTTLYLNGVPITELHIPDGVTSINDYAFYNCDSLTEVTIPNSVTNIGWYAFDKCSNLVNVSIGDGVTSIGYGAFWECKALREVTIGKSVTTIGNYAFYECEKLENIELPESVISIGEDAFHECESLLSINIPQNVTTIGNAAFLECSSLTSITIPDGVSKIEGYVFAYCFDLKTITIPASITSIGDDAFYDCSSLKTVFFEGTREQKEAMRIGVDNEEIECAKWHFEVENAVFANQECYYCKECNNYYLYDGSYATATVVFKNWDGTELSKQTYRYNDKITVPPTPQKLSDSTFEYIFVGWDKDVVNCEGDTIYTAIYMPKYIDYTVSFMDWDGTIISSEAYHYGDKVTVPAAPERKDDNTYTYTFGGWDKTIVDCTGNATYTATYISNYINYTVTFKNWDGTVLDAKTYHYGDKVTVPVAPIKESDNIYEYIFAGWDKEVVNCVGDETYTATYTSDYIDYIVVFKDWDGTVLSTMTYNYADKITIPDNPTRAADNTYTYSFIGWDREIVNCIGNATYTAVYSQYYINYTVVFKNYDGMLISSNSYHYGDIVQEPDIPTKDSDQYGYYIFTGWDKPVTNCTKNIIYTATYKTEYIEYIIKFQNWDGSILLQKFYHYGDKVESPVNPVREANNIYTYSFVGWDKKVVACAGNTTYTATYKPSYIDYTVVFKNWNGDELSTQKYHYGDKVIVPTNPTRIADKTYTYTFAGWDKTVVDCTGEAIYTAKYTPAFIDYTVVFKDWNGAALSTKTYHYGDKVTVPDHPTKAADSTYTYTFNGWDNDVVNCAGDATYTATYTSEYIDYTVTFQYEDGTVIKQYTLHYGDSVVVPVEPAVPDKLGGNYEFCGWDKEITVCQGDTVYTAVFVRKYISGDLTGDDKINSLDGLLLMRYLNGWNVNITSPDAMDVNGDGKVNSLDGLILMRYLNGWNVTLG